MDRAKKTEYICERPVRPWHVAIRKSTIHQQQGQAQRTYGGVKLRTIIYLELRIYTSVIAESSVSCLSRISRSSKSCFTHPKEQAFLSKGRNAS